jgi:hypothetical protein
MGKMFSSIDMNSNSITAVNQVAAVSVTCSGDIHAADDVDAGDQMTCAHITADGGTSYFDDVLPNDNAIWDLGSAGSQWNDLYLAGSIIGDITLDGDIIVDGKFKLPVGTNLY